MYKIMQQKNPEDFVLATNTSYQIKDFIDISLTYLNINYKWLGNDPSKMKCIDTKTKKVIFQTDKNFYRPLDLTYLKGNYNKAKKKLKWQPKTKIKSLIKMMIDFDLENEK